MPVSQILSAKGRDVVTAASTDKVAHIAGKLAENRIGAIVIIDEAGAIEGILSERDIVRLIAKEGADALAREAGSIMSRSVKTCREGDSEKDLMRLMTENRIRHLPVVHNNRLIGMVSIGDVVKFRIENIEREAEEMKNYIASAG
jgi:CBS domain-containing protein